MEVMRTKGIHPGEESSQTKVSSRSGCSSLELKWSEKERLREPMHIKAAHFWRVSNASKALSMGRLFRQTSNDV